LRNLTHHETGHRIPAAAIPIAGTRIRAIAVEAEEAIGRVGLDVVNLVNPAVKTELDVMLTVHFVERGGKLSCILA